MDNNPTKEIDTETIMRQIRRDTLIKKTSLGGCLPRTERPENAPAGNRSTAPSPRDPKATDSSMRKTHYRVQNLLGFQGQDFIRNAYLSILNREPDPEGAAYYLGAICTGSLSKIEVLGRLRYSAEGRREGQTIAGLMPRFAFKLLTKLPVVGYAVAVIAVLSRLPNVARRIDQLEAVMYSEDNKLRDQFDTQLLEQQQAIQSLAKILEDFSRHPVRGESIHRSRKTGAP